MKIMAQETVAGGGEEKRVKGAHLQREGRGRGARSFMKRVGGRDG